LVLLKKYLYPYGFLIFVPVALTLSYLKFSPLVILIFSALALIPLSWLLGEATEGLAARAGAGIGAFLNSTLGNAAELIIAYFALREGLTELVKASITGSIIGNSLFLMGLSLLAGGWRKKKQFFNQTAAGIYATLLLLSSISLFIPAIYHYTVRAVQQIELEISAEIGVVLFVTYALSLVFVFRTHPHLYTSYKSQKEHHGAPELSTSLLLLFFSGAFSAWISEALIKAIEKSMAVFNISEVFMGVIVVALIGNVSEHFSAINAAVDDDLNLSIGISLGSSVQVALFVAPILLGLGFLIGQPFDFVFTPLEVVSVFLAVLTLGFISLDGETNWFEGVLLLAVYAVLVLAFFFHP
jgi:Ca2+:H+ antiporter